MAKIFNITAININNGQEIADWIYKKLHDQDINPDDLNTGELITEACKALGWASVPQVGGIEIEWDSALMITKATELKRLMAKVGKTARSKPGAKPGNKNAQHDVEASTSQIHARCTPRNKAMWVTAAQAKNLKLTAWITKILNGAIK